MFETRGVKFLPRQVVLDIPPLARSSTEIKGGKSRDPATGNSSPDAGSKGMVLPFKPLHMTFKDMCYSVDMPAVRLRVPEC